MDSAITLVFQLAILVMSVVIHEVSHGAIAYALGDSTAKYAGRLTLNPLAHIDPVGSILVPLASFFLGGFVIGWAKPVPYDPRNLRIANTDVGGAIVGAAGPLSNIALALIFGLGFRVLAGMDAAFASPVSVVFAMITVTNLSLAIFNLVPIPPLDGSKVLFAIFPSRWWRLRALLGQYGFVLLLLFIFYLSGWIVPIISGLFRALTGIGFGL
jgi:Zn-dependent protease